MIRRLIAITFAAAALLPAAKVDSFRRERNTVRFMLGDGAAEIEWINGDTFRLYRGWKKTLAPVNELTEGLVKFSILERERDLLIKTDLLTLEIDRENFRIRVFDPRRNLWLTNWEEHAPRMFRRELLPDERIYGVGPREDARLNARGQKIRAEHPFWLSSRGYGVFIPSGNFDVDLTTPQLEVRSLADAETQYYFYLGPRLKDIYERHSWVAPQRWFYTREMTRANDAPRRPFFAPEVPRSLPWVLQASLAGLTVPTVNCREHFEPWCTFMPSLIADPADANPMRTALEPYLVAYYQEVKDRGIPVLRPLPLQFPADRELSDAADAFMLGDELLVAPLPPAANRRSLRLPMGRWTDLRTGIEYAGRQTISVEGPASNVPLFAKNGTIVPFARAGFYEIHYFPQLGAEFFLYELEQAKWSQLHASPAGDFWRLEIESIVTREYEWVLHHVDSPRAVECAQTAVKHTYDEKRRELRVRLKAPANADVIVNIRF
ncbi:MAG: hypothetical protein K2Q23_03040 [Bryobacteraceae bacterium]|nr:hypothetical protein [Bryobacteraceae bacterium]